MLTCMNNWTCLPVSICNAIDEELGNFLTLLGHDGSQRPYTGKYQSMPAGFHTQECIDALLKLGWAATPILYRPEIQACVGGPIRDVFLNPDDRFWAHTSAARGFIIGSLYPDESHPAPRGHAMSVSYGDFYDPRGRGNWYSAGGSLLKDFNPHTFYRLEEL